MRHLSLSMLALAGLFGTSCSCSNTSKPTIVSFAAVPDVIGPNGTTALVWDVKDATSVSLDQGLGTVTTTALAVRPTTTTTYTLTATNSNGTATSTATVTVDPGAATGQVAFRVESTHAPSSGLPTLTAGVPEAVRLTAVDGSGAKLTSYVGTVRVTTSDPQAPLPTVVTFSAADQGVSSALIAAATAGVVTILAQDSKVPGRQGSSQFQVVPGPVKRLTLQGPAAVYAGDPAGVVVSATDAYANPVPDYRGTVALTVAGAVLGTGGFTAADQGRHVISLTLTSPGDVTLTATDQADSSLVGTLMVHVSVRPSALWLSTDGGAFTAGVAQEVTITARDGVGNVATEYAGTVHLSTSDGTTGVALPADPTFGPADHGVKTVSVTLAGAGSQTLGVADVASSALSASLPVQVVPAAASRCTLTAPATGALTAPLAVTATLFDPFGNLATSYGGTLSLAAADARATLPAPYAFAAGDRGAHTFSVALGSPGAQGLTASDGTLTCTASVTVAPLPAVRLAVELVAGPVTAGVAASLKVTATDRLGSTASGYLGTVHVTSSDANAAVVLPSDVAFTAGDQGVRLLPITLASAGTTQVTVTDVSASAVHGQVALLVGPAGASRCAVKAPAAARAAAPVSLTVSLSDRFGNAASAYLGTVTLTSSDGKAALPPATAYGAGDSGAHTFSATFGTPGTTTVTAGDGALTCATTLTVSAGPASQFSLDPLPGDVVAGATVPVRVTATDAYGNPATDYAGPTTLTSSDAAGTTALGAFSAGVAVGTAVFGTIGGQHLTVTDGPLGFTARAATGVHGLTYLPSTATNATLRLTLDGPASNAGKLVLHLVAEAPFTGYAAGFNIAADGSRAGVVGIDRGVTLDPGASPPAMAAALATSGPLANTLTSGVSQKASGVGAIASDTAVTEGQVVYTLTLKPISTTPGVVFDGAQPFRAAVRNRQGDELVSQQGFAVGRVELR